MLGIAYRKYFPREIYHLPCGLTIYESTFSNSDGTRGVLAGPHRIITETYKSYKSAHMAGVGLPMLKYEKASIFRHNDTHLFIVTGGNVYSSIG